MRVEYLPITQGKTTTACGEYNDYELKTHYLFSRLAL